MNYIKEEEVELLEIPSDLVPKNYIMNPKTDDLIESSELREGMIVLLEDGILRPDPEEASRSVYSEISVQEIARWCKITKLRRSNENSEIISFIGLYADGVKMSRRYNLANYWIVKKNSQ